MSTVTPTKTRMTAEEFCDWVHRPENQNRWFELVRGEVIEFPPPVKIHSTVCANVTGLLWTFTRQRSFGYVASNDTGVILERDPDMVRGPDVALYEDAQAFDELHPKYGEVPPVLAVEVVSPNDRVKRVTDKIMDYLKNGVRVVWLIDPEEKAVSVYRPGQGTQSLNGDQELSGGEELPGFVCRVSDIFFVPGKKPAAGG